VSDEITRRTYVREESVDAMS